jgi:hypothetical protein
MSDKYTEAESPVDFLKNESARKRWELFHRAIAHAKRSNDDDLIKADVEPRDPEAAVPKLSVVR